MSFIDVERYFMLAATFRRNGKQDQWPAGPNRDNKSWKKSLGKTGRTDANSVWGIVQI